MRIQWRNAFFLALIAATKAGAEVWILVTEDHRLVRESYTVSEYPEGLTIESDYMSAVFGNAKVARICFHDGESAAIWFGDATYEATYAIEASGIVRFTLKEPSSGWFVMTVSPEKNGNRRFAYELEQDFAPFTGQAPMHLQQVEIDLLMKHDGNEYTREMLCSGSRYVRYQGAVETVEP
jgi:hypothetical protein